MGTRPRGRSKNLMVFAAATVALLAGCVSNGQQQSSDTNTPLPAATVSVSPSTMANEVGTPSVMPEAAPTSVSIPSINAESELIALGLNADGTIEVPGTAPGSPAGWYTGSPTPGELGPAILLGHVNATGGGPGVFADLRDMSSGDVIDVKRADGSTVSFRFTKGEQYSKSSFPSDSVYGNTPNAELRLITCDGFNSETGEFDDNYVVYAELIS